MTKNTSTPLGDHFECSVDQYIERGRCRSGSDVVGLQDHERQGAVLREALIDGENSGKAHELDMKKIKANARCRPSH